MPWHQTARRMLALSARCSQSAPLEKIRKEVQVVPSSNPKPWGNVAADSDNLKQISVNKLLLAEHFLNCCVASLVWRRK